MSYISTKIDGPTTFYKMEPVKTPLVYIPANVNKLIFKDDNDKIISGKENYITSGYLTQGSRYQRWPKDATKVLFKYFNKPDQIVKKDS